LQGKKCAESFAFSLHKESSGLLRMCAVWSTHLLQEKEQVAATGTRSGGDGATFVENPHDLWMMHEDKNNDSIFVAEDYSTTEHVDDKSLEKTLKLRPGPDGKYHKVIDVIADPDELAAAYDRWKSNKLEMESFHSHEEIDRSWFGQATRELLSGTYKFKPARTINIRKLGEPPDEVRQLKVIHPKDWIVQEAIKTALEDIYDSTISENAHKSRHAALRYVRRWWRGMSWFFEVNVDEKSYDTTNHLTVLKHILAEKIQDQRFLDTITQVFDAGTLSVGRSPSEEGSVLASILCNIYFQKLDEEMDQIKQECNTVPKKYSINPAYRKLMVLKQRTLARLGEDPEAMRRERRHRLGIVKKLQISLHNYKDPGYLEVQYVRFGDNILIGVAGKKSMALKIMERVTMYLQSNLSIQVNTERTRLSHAISDKLLFMGVLLQLRDPKDRPEMSTATIRAIKKKRAQSLRINQQLEDQWERESRRAVLKCWTVAYEKWHWDLVKDGAKRHAIQTTTIQHLLVMPEEESRQWQMNTRETLKLFITAALRLGLFPEQEVQKFNKILVMLQKTTAQKPEHLEAG
jgi:retron-type reverse transcriptase